MAITWRALASTGLLMTPQAATANGIRFTGLAHVLPSRQVTNEEVLDRVRERSAPFLSERELDELTTATSAALRSAGTQVRYHRAEGERAYELCLRAGAEVSWSRPPQMCSRTCSGLRTRRALTSWTPAPVGSAPSTSRARCCAGVATATR